MIDDIIDDNKPMRFASGWDPVSMFDMNARTTYKPPETNFDIIKNFTNPSLESIINTVQSGFPDPLMGVHSMYVTYSNPSSVKILLKVE